MPTRKDSRPLDGRPLPKRLFSIDSLRKERSGSESDASSIASKEFTKRSRIPSQVSLAGSVQTGSLADGGAQITLNQEPGRWTDGVTARSPDEMREQAQTEVNQTKKVPVQRPVPLKLAQGSKGGMGDEAPLPSPGRRRWDTLRAHVLPSANSSAPPTPFTRPGTPGSAGTNSPPPSRPATPRSYRFGQKMFLRQVVEQAREVAVDEHRRFADGILKACWDARFGDASTRAKPEREPSQGTITSTLHLPFMMSTTSLPIAGSQSTSSVQTMRRQASSQTVASDPRSPSIALLQYALTSNPSANRPSRLPYETHVLSALLVPFLGPHRGNELPFEQETAVETFEYLIRTWKAPSNEVGLERCLWCCDAASVPSGSRVRILGALSSILFSRDRTFAVESPAILKSLFQGLFSLLMCLASSPSSRAEADSLREFILAIQDGQCGTPTPQSLEKEYGVRWSKDDNSEDTRHLIAIEGLISCLEIGSENSRKWMLRNLLEEYWPAIKPSLTLTSLLSCIHARKFKIFVSSASALLFSGAASSAATELADVAIISRIFCTRILPEIQSIHDRDAAESRNCVLRLALNLTSIRGHAERGAVIEQIFTWYLDSGGWRSNIEDAIQDLIMNGEWPLILRLLPAVSEDYPEDARKAMVSLMVPLLHDRLMANAPEFPCPPLSNFLDRISHSYPKVFFKPIFTCAVSGKDLTLANQICIMNCLARYLADFWCRDAEMMSVALTSDPAGTKKPAPGGGPVWGKTRIGQSILLLELIEFLRVVRRTQDVSVSASAVKFGASLEARLGALVQAKEQTARIPRSQRILFCALFREIKLLTRSLKSASWLPSVISWVIDEDVVRTDSEEEEEVSTSFNKLHALYAHAQEALRGGSKRRTTIFTSPVIDSQRSKTSRENPIYEMLTGRIASLDSLHKPISHIAFPLLVLTSGLLRPDDYARLGSILWSQCLDTIDSGINASTTFLIMQCAEKGPTDFLKLIEDDLTHADARVRRVAIERIANICSWRSQILSQEVLLDRTYRRPFKLARPPITFVPTDMGASGFAVDEDVYEFKDTHGHVLPLELRRRLADIGWDQEDQILDPKTQWIKTPMSMLPSLQLDVLDTPAEETLAISESPNPSPEASPTSSPSDDTRLLRRDSSTSSSSRSAKRRPVFVSSLVSLFPRLISMANDSDFIVASAARDFIVDLMRDDPALLSRTIFHDISGDERSLISASTTVKTLLHIQHVLPPMITHHLLNHLAGFIKSSNRQSDKVNPLQSYAYSVPAIAQLVRQVSKMSVREIRRAKVDMFLLPSGSLWFPPSAPAGAMFPRGLEGAQNPCGPLPSSLVWITLIRTAQNMLFLRMLERDPQELKIIRKNLSRLVLPSRDESADQGFLPFNSFVPRRRSEGQTSNDADLIALSLTLARSYLLLVAQMFWSMSRHLNDRQELAILVDGLNRVLLAHGDDIGIVGHAMLALMLASTRFKRMFVSGGAYALFMPAIVKTYCMAESHPGIRAAIEYAVNRFYALHQESFVFQSFDAISHMFMTSDVDHAWLAQNVYSLFSTLKNGTAPIAPDVAGIYDLNKLQEQENRMVAVAEEVPQTFLASLRRGKAGRNQVTLVLPEEYEFKRLGLDNLVRLFLTVIAHNPGIQRAERFLRLLRFLAPALYIGSSAARSVLRDGVDALGSILLTRTAAKTKQQEGVHTRAADDFSYELLVEGNGHEPQQAISPGDLLGMRLDYLSLVTALTQGGGQLSPTTSGRIMELIKLILKDSIISSDRVAAFLTDYLTTVLVREPAPPLKEVLAILNDLLPIVSAYCTSVNFSAVFDVLTTLSGNTVFANEPLFAQLITRYCRAGLEACEAAAAENWLLSLPSRMSIITLMNAAIPLMGSDILDELEKHAPSYAFLAGVVLPFVLSMKTSADLAADAQWTDSRRREVHSRAWIRLLTYILSACQSPSIAKGQPRANPLFPERRKSQDSRTSIASMKPAMAFSLALQMLKIIVVRAEDDLSSTLPNVWFHVGSILRSLLSDGDAAFALQIRDYSEPPSPLHSPRLGSFSQDQKSSPLLPSTSSSRSLDRLASPRLIDYLTWSFIQWLCLRRSPLVLQMQGFVQEKVACVYRDLTEGRPNVSVSLGASPTSNRRLSIFTKPRRSMVNESAVSSAASTPRNSTFLNASLSLPTFDESSFQASTPRKTDGRLAGYAREASPASPSARAAGPRIVHLGPVSPHHPMYGEAGARRSPSPGGSATRGRGAGAQAAAREMVVTSPVLVRATYRRVRLAQAVLGYTTLLPMGEEDERVEVHAWTRREAVEAVLQEVKDLMEEFREDGAAAAGEYTDVGEGSGILVDLEEPPSPSKQG